MTRSRYWQTFRASTRSSQDILPLTRTTRVAPIDNIR